MNNVLSDTPEHSIQSTVQTNSYLTLHYRIALITNPEQDVTNDVMNTFEGKPATLQLGCQQLAEPLEAKLLGLKVGDQASFDLTAAEAFGSHNADLVQTVSRKLFDHEGASPTDYQCGDWVEFNAPNGACYAGTLIEINQQNALFDFNHPLAGQAIRFEVKILGIL